MNGMLYKIVPFLTWFHLNAKGIFTIPTMRDMIPIKNMQIQFYFHLSSLILFFIGFSMASSVIIRLAIILFIISNIIFFINLFRTVKIYLQTENN